ncbi:protein phosphatase 2c family protein [Fadolivirus algeromassiliense]|jgi:protein phosphatase 2C family protein 2/3|uniref:Protein phosphatase 2c family protein n=1 Tax=Fadolivirus FV1/VV64 TaxID=3070911 RepID=A0A7D3R1T4_9VIRU|nr:protein phosphatase 2c family protein [Fadolivirus algeromassiliense]QKF94762.1 protein phosphatase 2c family protein [Fadolivirus FV1/VV64]
MTTQAPASLSHDGLTIQRRSSEDEHTYSRFSESENMVSVFDGHGGKGVADFLKQNFHTLVAEQLQRIRDSLKVSDEEVTKTLTAILREINQKILDNPEIKEHGATLSSILRVGNKLIAFHTGDGRIIGCKGNEIKYVSNDHKPTNPDETARIRDAGGVVFKGRVCGGLAVSRAMGDGSYSDWVIPDPEVAVLNVSDFTHFIVFSDGVHDSMKNEEIAKCHTTKQISDIVASRASPYMERNDDYTSCFFWLDFDYKANVMATA